MCRANLEVADGGSHSCKGDSHDDSRAQRSGVAFEFDRLRRRGRCGRRGTARSSGSRSGGGAITVPVVAVRFAAHRLGWAGNSGRSSVGVRVIG